MPSMTTSPAIAGAAVALAAIIGATVAVCLGHIDAGAYSGLIGVALGGGVGAGAHAVGATQAKE